MTPRTVSTTGLLSPAEEVRLARLMQVGVDAEAAITEGRGTADDRAAAARGRRARHRFIEANLGLVHSMARRFGRPRHVPLEDVVQDGMIGLHVAVDRFDPDAGFRFSTYASWWIRQTMQKGLEVSAGPIRIPHAVRSASLNEPEDPSDSNSLEAMARTAGRVDSIDAVPGWSDSVACSASEDPGMEAIEGVLMERIGEELDQLDPLTRRQLDRWFGIDGKEAESLRRIAANEGMSATAVRKRIEKGLDQLRHGCNLVPAA